MKNNILFIFLLLSTVVFGQNLKGNYSGYWAMTNWSYFFDGNFEYKTTGHFGITSTKGKYEIKKDTVYLKAKKTGKGTLDVDERMLIDKDSCIIDLVMRYDYCESKDNEFIKSKKRNFRFPQIITDNPEIKLDLKKVLNLVFTNPKVKAYLHFDQLPNRRLLFKPYYEFSELNFSGFQIEDKIIEFTQSDLPDFYIEFIEINQMRDRIEIEFEMKDEGVEFTMHYKYINSKWELEYQNHHEK